MEDKDMLIENNLFWKSDGLDNDLRIKVEVSHQMNKAGLE